MRKIPVVICIDVEPEEREIPSAAASDWPGFEETVDLFTTFRRRVTDATASPAHFSWFFRMDPQVAHTYGEAAWVARRYPDAIKRLEVAQDELGLHTHAWRWDCDRNRWVVDHGDQRWIDHCVQTSFAAYRSVFGRACRSFRFGDHWMNDATMDLLESLGVEYDLTVEPGVKAKSALIADETHTGSLPDYTAAPRWPYRPSRRDFRKHGRTGRRDLWALPISTGRDDIGRYAAMKRAALALGLDVHARYEATPLWLALDPPLFQAMTTNLLGVWRKAYLAPAVRTDAGSKAAYRANLERNLEFLLTHRLVTRFQFVRPDEAVEALR